MFSPGELTRQAYDGHAEAWRDAHDTPGFWAQEMDRFAQLLPAGHVLEVGAGAGRDAAELIARGYGYTGIDYSRGMLELARQRLPGADFREQDMCHLDLPGCEFDGFWAAMSLLHIPKAQIGAVLQRIHALMRAGAIGFVALKRGTGEGLGESDTPGMSRFFAWWQREEFGEVLNRNAFQVVSWEAPGSRLCFYVRALATQ